MKRFTTIELCALMVGVLFVAAGLWVTIWPRSGIVLHFTNDALGIHVRNELEGVSQSGSQTYGVLAIVAGFVMVAVSLYRGKR